MHESENDSAWTHRLLGACAQMPAGDRRRLRRATWILAAWAVTYVGAALAIERSLVPAGAASYALAAVPILTAIAAVTAYAHFLRHADELQRKIQLEAMALGFGGGFVVSYGLRVLEQAGLPAASAGTPFTLMVFFYLVGILRSSRRYS